MWPVVVGVVSALTCLVQVLALPVELLGSPSTPEGLSYYVRRGDLVLAGYQGCSTVRTVVWELRDLVLMLQAYSDIIQTLQEGAKQKGWPYLGLRVEPCSVW